MMIFKKKKKKNQFSSLYTVVNSVLEELDTWCRVLTWSSSNNDAGTSLNDASEQIKILRMEVRLLRTFLMYVANWTDERLDQLGSLALDLQSAFKKAMKGFVVASSDKGYSRRFTEYVLPAISKLQEQLTLYRPQIRETYDYVLGNSFQSHHPYSNYDLWALLALSLSDNLLQLQNHTSELLAPIMPQLFALREMISHLMFFLNHVKEEDGFMNVLAHFGAVLVRGAHICYLSWVDRMDESMSRNSNTMLFVLLKQFRLNTPQFLHLCLNFLRVKNSSSYQVEIVLDFLIAHQNLLPTLRKGFRNLISFAIRQPNVYEDDDVKMLLMDITAAVSKLESFGYSYHSEDAVPDAAKEKDTAIFKIVEKIELVNAEQFLLVLVQELLHGRIPEKSFVKDRVDSFQDGLNSLHHFEGNYAIPDPVWTYIGPLVRDAESVYLSFLSRSITDDKALDELSKLCQKIKLFKIEIFLQDLLCDRTNMNINVMNQIETLYEGLKVLRTFLMSPPEENGKLIIARVESVARKIVSVYCSFNTSKVTDEKVRRVVSLLPELVESIEQVNADLKEFYLHVRASLQSNFPKTHGFGFIDFLLEKLRELVNSESDSIASMKYQIQVVHKEIGFLRSYIEEQCSQHHELKSLVSRILLVAYEAEYVIDSFLVRGGVTWYHSLWLCDLIEDIKHIRIQASDISEYRQCTDVNDIPQTKKVAISPAKVSQIDEVVVELVDQSKSLINKLTRGSVHRQVIPIVGMAGLGKTTLARKVYNDPSITYHFHICAWCDVSPVYQKRKLLLDILVHFVKLSDTFLEMSAEELDFELYKCLKKRKYLIVMDDMWDIEAWTDLERSFPNDQNGSRILITSRVTDVVSKTKSGSIIHPLRPFSADESWELLQKKLFHTEDCPNDLVAFGKQIARSCKGLPLAVVAVSGLLQRTEMTPDWWKEVAENLCTHIAKDPESMCMGILELSYKHLPDYLKPCFLYLGAFFLDKEISVRKLTWLWVAEGFIQNTQLESVEDLAEEYLKDLIGRCMVIASRRRSNGGVKTCCVHGLLRTLCLQRCKEERFLQTVPGFDTLCSTSYDDSDNDVDPSHSYPTDATAYDVRRLSIYSKRNHFVMSRPRGPLVRPLLYSARSDSYPTCPYSISFISDNFKLLRTLNLECINMGNSFPDGIDLLILLRYLALCGDIDNISVSVSNLKNLETLLIKGLKGRVLVPQTVWSMSKLRHVHINNIVAFSIQGSSRLENLLSLSYPFLSCEKGTENIMRLLPKLRKLKCIFLEPRENAGNCNHFPVLDFLTELESLNILYSGWTANPSAFNFPLRLKKLTLSKFHLPWDRISEIGKLPYLEVLKLLSRSFEGKLWDMKEGEFLKLKFLKLATLNIAQWNASSDNLPNLQHLVLQSCRQLEVVPLVLLTCLLWRLLRYKCADPLLKSQLEN